MKINATKTTVWAALAFSIIWVGVAVSYLQMNGINLFCVELIDFGTFVGGVFAPLAVIWLIVSVFIQRAELSAGITEMKNQSAAQLKQAKAMETNLNRSVSNAALREIEEHRKHQPQFSTGGSSTSRGKGQRLTLTLLSPEIHDIRVEGLENAVDDRIIQRLRTDENLSLVMPEVSNEVKSASWRITYTDKLNLRSYIEISYDAYSKARKWHFSEPLPVQGT